MIGGRFKGLDKGLLYCPHCLRSKIVSMDIYNEESMNHVCTTGDLTAAQVDARV